MAVATYRAHHCISSDHPCLAGHFPGQPIVPGVLLLDIVLATLREWRGNCHLRALPAVKFSAPLAPGQPFVIELASDAKLRVRFSCYCDDTSFATGQMNLLKDG